MEIKKITVLELKEALVLIKRVFDEFVAIDYSEEGINGFYHFIDYQEIMKKFEQGKIDFWGCFINNQIVGVISTREHNHICLLFVDREYQRRGIARKLLQEVIIEACNHQKQKLTVNSSPFAIDIYKHLGFIITDEEQIVGGIRFTPMEYQIKCD